MDKTPSEIKIGDEIKYGSNDIVGVVMEIRNNHIVCGYTSDGNQFDWNARFIKKTGRHFPQIAEVFEQMKGTQRKEATKRQIKYATYLAKRMCVDLPKENTKEAYSNFISKYADAVRAEDEGMNEPDAWQINYM